MKNEKRSFEIGVLGLWHLGCVYAAALASLGYKVTGFDPDKKTVSNLNRAIPPIYEPELAETIKKHLHGNLSFSQNPKEAITGKKYVFVTMDIPVDGKDRINMEPFNYLITLLIKYASNATKIVISSQVPIGTCRLTAQQLTEAQKNISLIYLPENIRLGDAFSAFLNPDRIVLGVNNGKITPEFIREFPHLKCPVLTMSWESAEMVKHALNTFLAANISFASELADLCELSGADMKDVVPALKTDKRISPAAPINPGLGFAGGTLGRDVQTLLKVSQKYKYKPLLIRAVYSVNNTRLQHILNLTEKILGSISSKNIGLLGLTYKPGTDTLRRSHSLELAALLHRKKARIKAYDPAVSKLGEKFHFIKVTDNANELFRGLDMAILMTGWPQFKKINPYEAGKSMRRKIVFDTGNFLPENKFISAGFKYYPIGKQL